MVNNVQNKASSPNNHQIYQVSQVQNNRQPNDQKPVIQLKINQAHQRINTEHLRLPPHYPQPPNQQNQIRMQLADALVAVFSQRLLKNLKFKPAFLANFISGAPSTATLSANFLFNDVLTAGASYRFDNAISGLVGFQISNSMFAGYSYDYNTNPIGQYNSGSHEIILKFYVGRGIRTKVDKN